MMQLSTAQAYKHEEIRALLEVCPICNSSDNMGIWSRMDHYLVRKGKEGITCETCRLDLAFTFNMNQDNEIIDEYALDYLKVGNLEFKNNDDQLVLYFNNTYVKDITGNIIDLNKYKAIMMLS